MQIGKIYPTYHMFGRICVLFCILLAMMIILAVFVGGDGLKPPTREWSSCLRPVGGFPFHIPKLSNMQQGSLEALPKVQSQMMVNRGIVKTCQNQIWWQCPHIFGWDANDLLKLGIVVAKLSQPGRAWQEKLAVMLPAWRDEKLWMMEVS